MIEEVKKILREALWMAYCSGRANNEYIPEEVLPELMKRCQLFEPEPISEEIYIDDKAHEEGIKRLHEADMPKPDESRLLTEKQIVEKCQLSPETAKLLRDMSEETYREIAREVIFLAEPIIIAKTASIYQQKIKEQFEEMEKNSAIEELPHRDGRTLIRMIPDNTFQALKKKVLG